LGRFHCQNISYILTDFGLYEEIDSISHTFVNSSLIESDRFNRCLQLTKFKHLLNTDIIRVIDGRKMHNITKRKKCNDKSRQLKYFETNKDYHSPFIFYKEEKGTINEKIYCFTYNDIPTLLRKGRNFLSNKPLDNDFLKNLNNLKNYRIFNPIVQRPTSTFHDSISP